MLLTDPDMRRTRKYKHNIQKYPRLATSLALTECGKCEVRVCSSYLLLALVPRRPSFAYVCILAKELQVYPPCNTTLQTPFQEAEQEKAKSNPPQSKSITSDLT